jgi:small subunit ribosomal protein S15
VQKDQEEAAMSLTKENKQEVITSFGRTEKDTGSAEVQIALLTRRIEELTGHFKTNPKDHSSRRGLLKMVGQRRRMLDYLKKTDIAKYRDIIGKLSLRK